MEGVEGASSYAPVPPEGGTSGGSSYSKVTVKGNKLLITDNRLARLVALGVSAERKARERAQRRRIVRASRKRNRRSK